MKQELMETIEIFIGQLRQLFGLKPNYLEQDMDGTIEFVVSEKGFTEWQAFFPTCLTIFITIHNLFCYGETTVPHNLCNFFFHVRYCMM
jgi:hypothetical protein